MSRLLLENMNLQAPPNLSPGGHRGLVRAGINDWGGISPVTQDFINPEAPWPHLQELTELCAGEGYRLMPRLPIYPEYLDFQRWIDPALEPVVLRHLGEVDSASLV